MCENRFVVYTVVSSGGLCTHPMAVDRTQCGPIVCAIVRSAFSITLVEMVNCN